MALNKDRIFKAADNYIRKNKIDKAISEYETWLKENPKDWNILRTVGDLYARISRNDEAIKKYALVADHYRRDGFNVRAIATYKMVLRLDANNEAAMRNLAELQAEEGLLMEAKSNLNTLVKLYNKQGHKKLAAEVFKKLAEIDPQDLKTRYSYAEFLNQSGKSEEAAEEYVGIADQLIGQGQVDDAVKILEKGSSIATNSPAIKVKLAHASSLQGNHAQAVRMLEDVRRGSPNDKMVLGRLGEAYLASGNTDQAQGVFQQLIEVDPDNPDNILRLADLRIAQGKLDTALDELTPLIDRRVGEGDGKGAADLIQKLLGKDPYHIRSLVKSAEVFTILKHDSARISAYDSLCEAYSRVGDFERAVQIAEQLVELDPESSQHKDRLKFFKSKLGGPAMTAAAASAPSVKPSAPAPARPPARSAKPPAPAPAPVASDQDLPDFGDLEEISTQVPDFGEVLVPEAEGAALASAPAALDLGDVIELTQEDEENIKEKLTEAEVFVRYGLVEKAVTQLVDVLESFRFHTESREKLIEIYQDQGMTQEAAEQLLHLSQVYDKLGRPDDAAKARAEATELNPALAAQAAASVHASPAEEEIELTLSEPSSEFDIGIEIEEPAAPVAPAPRFAPPAAEEIPLSAEEAAFNEPSIDISLDEGVGEEEIGIEMDLGDDSLPAGDLGLDSEEFSVDVEESSADVEVDIDVEVESSEVPEPVVSVSANDSEIDIDLSVSAPDIPFAVEESPVGSAADDLSVEIPLESEPDGEETLVDDGGPSLDELATSLPKIDVPEPVASEEEFSVEIDEPDELAIDIPDAIADEGPAAEEPQETFAPSLDTFGDASSASASEIEIDVPGLDDAEDADLDVDIEVALDAPMPEPPKAAPAKAPPQAAESPAPKPAPPAPEPSPVIVPEPELEPEPEPVAATPVAPPRPAEPVSPLAGELAEVDEYIALGLYEDARDNLRELLKHHPGDAGVLSKIEELGFSVEQIQMEVAASGSQRLVAAPIPEEQEAEEVGLPSSGEVEFEPEPELEPELAAELEPAAPKSHPVFPKSSVPEPVEPLHEELTGIEELVSSATPEPVGAASENENDFIDLASELSDEIFGTHSALEEDTPDAEGPLTDPGLDQIFREFRKGVEKQLGTEDYDTRYNLGIAYKEMGLLDEAIAEFQLAAKDEVRGLECCSMLGLCFMEKGMPDIAIKWFSKGLDIPGRREEEYHGLRYDLAQAFEAASHPDRALMLYMEIFKENASFRDVKDRLRELQAAQK